MTSQEIKPNTEANDTTASTCKVDEFIKKGFKSCVEATKSSNDLPKGRDFDFYSTHPSFVAAISGGGDRVLALMNQLFRANSIDGLMRSKTAIAAKEELLGDANDTILDRATVVIDEMNGLRSIPADPVIQTVSAQVTINGSWNKVNSMTVSAGAQNEVAPCINNKAMHLLTAKNIVRPQTYFKDKIENGNEYPWMPRIKEKPNSLKPLALYLEPNPDVGTLEEYSHPYEFELDHFNVPDEFIADIELVESVKDILVTPLYEITTESKVDELVEELRKHKVIAVDLEHHSYRTFQGITCLMQISTREADYLIDTLALRHKLYVLNEIFTKPTILKIFHGASSDIQWLQRDLSIYVVNMFDTHQAAKLLGHSSLSLAYLLKRYCSFMPNKKFQLADWRIRPLPDELKDYAREDTHYLIYVYEVLKKELYEKSNGKDNLIRAVFHASTEICKTKYIKPRWTPDAHLRIYERRKRLFDNRQMYALQEIYKWRDAFARETDESTGYVLPNHMMLQISETLPREVQGILACCNPIPPLVRANSLELHHIILKAREQPLEKPIMPDTNRRIISKEAVKLNIDSRLHCPHDLTKNDFKDNLPTLLNNNNTNEQSRQMTKRLPLEKVEMDCKIFGSDSGVTKSFEITNIEFLGPFERYKMIKPLLQVEADKEKTAAAQADDPCVEDRIAALHEHFMKSQGTAAVDETAPTTSEVSIKQMEPISDTPTLMSLTLDEPLITMPGSTKRKRDASEVRSTQKNTEKRPRTDCYDDDNQETIPPTPKHVQPNKNSKKKQEKFKKPRMQQRDEQHANANLTGYQHNQQQHHSARGYQNHRGNRGHKSNRGYRKNQGSGSNEPMAYDYSQVDFSQFSGGGRSANPQQFDSKHRGKGQNRRGRGGGHRNERSMTFVHRGSQRGHGRGRK